MKIGILTVPLHTNYGGILQAYALQTILERLGHQVVVFNHEWKYSLPLWRLPISYTIRIIKKYILGKKDTIIFAEQHRTKEFSIIRQHTQRFIDKYIHTYNVNSLKKIKPTDFDAIVVGSDQVWRPKCFEQLFKTDITNAFLKFAKNWDLKRLSYAASFGVDNWEYNENQTKRCRYLLKKFNAISVREESGINLCNDNLGVNAEHVLDPTMLLTKEDYELLLNKENETVIEGQIMTYILDISKEKEDFVNRIKDITRYKAFLANEKSRNSYNLKDKIQPPIEHWIQGFRDAKLIITDSFHACVFSIIFRKPFLVIINEERGASRFSSLLKMFKLEDRIVNLKSDVSKAIIESPIPDSVYDTLSYMRCKSFNFLNILNNE